MKLAKRILSVLMVISAVAMCFAGCSSNQDEKYTDKTAVLGYTKEVAPFLTKAENGTISGFMPELWDSIFDSVKGDLKEYTFEQVDEGYTLEEDGGFINSSGKEYSACLLLGAVSKNYGTFNEDYSYTEPIITNRIITVTKDGKVQDYSDFSGKNVAVVSDTAKTAFQKHKTIYDACAEVTDVDDINVALSDFDNGKFDAVVTDEFTYCPLGRDNDVLLDGEFDKIEYVIACAKNSGWKDSINEAIREMKSETYGNGDDFTPLVTKHFGYNASSFDYQTDVDKNA